MEIQQIGSDCIGVNLGGFNAIYLIRVIDILNFPIVTDGKYIDEIELIPEAVLFKLIASQDGIEYKIQDKWTDAGIVWNHTVSVTTSQEYSDQIKNFVYQNRQHYFVAILKAPNGSYYLVGTPDFPMILNSQDINHGRTITERPERVLSLQTMMLTDKLQYEPTAFIIDEAALPIITPDDEGLNG